MNIRLYLSFIYFTNIFFNMYSAEEPRRFLPIVFHEQYDISFFGLEKVHPFDSKKYGKVHNKLINSGIKGLTKYSFHKPDYVTDADLKKVHTQEYLDSLYSSWTLQDICRVPGLGLLPNILLRRNLLTPMRYATGGTIKAVELALDQNNTKKYAINLSGGYHHAKTGSGGGFCVYADIQLAIEKAWEKNPDLKILYVDLDAHHGNGVAHYFGNKNKTGVWQRSSSSSDDWWDKKKEKIVIFDMYSYPNYPREVSITGRFVKYKYPISSTDTGENYLDTLFDKLSEVIYGEKPDLIFYNAGTDPYKGDQIGHMNLSEKDIIDRDAFVFKEAKRLYNIPIVMTLSGGYSAESADIIAASIQNIISIMDGTPYTT